MFIPRVDKIADTQFGWKQVSQSLCVQDQIVVQVSRVGGQKGHLLGSRFDHMRMTMTDMSHIVDTVQVRVSLFVQHVLTFALHDFDGRLFEEQSHRSTEKSTNRITNYLKKLLKN